MNNELVTDVAVIAIEQVGKANLSQAFRAIAAKAGRASVQSIKGIPNALVKVGQTASDPRTKFMIGGALLVTAGAGITVVAVKAAAPIVVRKTVDTAKIVHDKTSMVCGRIVDWAHSSEEEAA